MLYDPIDLGDGAYKLSADLVNRVAAEKGWTVEETGDMLYQLDITEVQELAADYRAADEETS